MLSYGSTDEDGTMTYTAMAADTVAKTAKYAVTVNKDKALSAVSTDDGDVAQLTGDKPAAITTAATSVPQASTSTATASGSTSTASTSTSMPSTTATATGVLHSFMMSPMATTHTVTFSVNGDTSVVASQTVNSGDTASKPTDSLGSSTRTFLGWYTSANATALYDFSTPVTSDITLYALFDYSGYYVTNTTYNYASGDTTTYRVDKAANIFYDAENIPVAAGGTFTVPATTFTITTHSTTEGVTATMVPGTATSGATISAIGATSATLNVPSGKSSVSATFTSQEPQDNVNLSKLWQDGAATAKPDISSLLVLQFSTDNGTNWTTLTADNMSTLGYNPGPPSRKAKLSAT